MPRSGDHRVRSFARWLATPLLLLDAVLIGYAVWSGEIPLLRIAAVSAFVVAVVSVALFDFELVRNRRDHGAERAAQAKAYIELYTQRLREHLHATAIPVPRLPEEEALAARTVGDTTAESEAGAQPKESKEEVSAPVPTPVSVPVPVPAVRRSDEDIWDDQDAPTVVDLIAYEVRARLAEDERKEQAAAAAAEEQKAAATGS